jgi:chitinase
MKLCLLLIVLAVSFAANGQFENDDSTFKVVGYYSLRSAINNDVKKLPFKKLTHINLYFLNPDSLGNYLKKLNKLTTFVNAAHVNNAKVLMSIGGGGPHPYYEKLLNDSNRTKLINHLFAIVMKYDLDGVDVDLEDKDINEYYDNFVIELASLLHQHNKIITAAVAIYFKDSYTDKALSQYDFINLMSYDHTGPWLPQNPGPHATYLQAENDLTYFRVERKIPKEKITLGVPFYGYGFGPAHIKRGISENYAHIINECHGAEMEDEIILDDSTTIYYNGIPTIKLKTELAKQQAGGIMIWQLSGDAPAPKSLLDAIDETAKEYKSLDAVRR